jgi:hypothetical protein
MIIILSWQTAISGAGAAEPLPELILVQIPQAALAQAAKKADKHLTVLAGYVDGCRIVRLRWQPNGTTAAEVLTSDFVSARDPAVSFDGRHILFSGKRKAEDRWQIWRMDRDGSNQMPITREAGHCLSPLYVGSLFYLNDKHPTPQITFVGTAHGWQSATSDQPVLALYACRPDGTDVRRVSYNLASDWDQDVLPNGRLVFSSQQPSSDADPGDATTRILAMNIDGTDLMAYAPAPHGGQMARHQLMARVSPSDRRMYYIASSGSEVLGGGTLAYISQRRPMHSRQVLADGQMGTYHSPAPLADGRLLAAYRPQGPQSTYAIWQIDLQSGVRRQRLFHQPGFHCVDIHALAAHPGVQGRSSVVGFRYKNSGVFFCLNSYISQLPAISNLPAGLVKQVRIIAGRPITTASQPTRGSGFRNVSGNKWTLGIAPVAADGSFHIRVPAQTPLSFQLLDAQGMALATQLSWSWVMPGESRGCIGCHEDPELVPPNVLAQAVIQPEVRLDANPDSIFRPSYRQMINPLVNARCLACHRKGGANPNFNGTKEDYNQLLGRRPALVIPGQARNSGLIMRLTSSNPNPCRDALDADQIEQFIEWVDLGAAYE